MQKSNIAPLPTLSVRIDLDTEGRIGPGKIQLLENIQACGSISAAGRAMDMSYKRAWDLVDEINRICRQARRRAADRRQRTEARRALTPFETLTGSRATGRSSATPHPLSRKELLALRSDIRRPKKAARPATKKGEKGAAVFIFASIARFRPS